jgi:hypothetical protein
MVNRIGVRYHPEYSAETAKLANKPFMFALSLPPLQNGRNQTQKRRFQAFLFIIY